MAEKNLSEIKTSKKKTQAEKSKEQTKAAVAKEKEKQQAKQKEKEKVLLSKEKEKQKAAVEKEREKQKEQQKLAIANAIVKEREKQKEAQQKAIDKAVAKERAKIREALVSGKDPFSKDNPLSKGQLKKAQALAQKDEETYDEENMASLALKLGEKKSIDDLFKEKENKEPQEGEEKVDHIELLRRKREAQAKLNASKEEPSNKENDLRAKLQAKGFDRPLIDETEALEPKEKVVSEDTDLNKQIELLTQEKDNLENKVNNLLETIDLKNEALKAKDEEIASLSKDDKEDSKDVIIELNDKVNGLEKEKKELERKIKSLLESIEKKTDELRSKDKEINVLGLEIAKLNEQVKETEPKQEITKEVEKIKVTGDLLLRIQSLQKRIEEKDAEINAMEEELNKLSEKDIVDPEFLVLIKRLRDERVELVSASNINLKSLAELVKKNEEKLAENKALASEKEKAYNDFEQNYQDSKGKLSYTEREELLKKRSKLIAEKDASLVSVEIVENSYNNYYNRYKLELERAENALKVLNDKEEELINEYLEKLRESKSIDNEELQVQLEERERLVKELEDANKEAIEQSENKEEEIELVKKEVNPDEDEILINLKGQLAQIEGKLGMIENKREERKNVEQVLRSSDSDVKEYLALYNQKETLSYMISEDQKRLNKANVELRDNPLKAKKSFFGKVKYDKADLEADQRRKDEVKRYEKLVAENKQKLSAIEEEIAKFDYLEKVLFYKKLLASINELNTREDELKKRQVEVKQSILNREEELKG